MVRGEPPCEGRQKTSGAQSGGLVSGQGAAAGQGTKARHRVPPRLMDVTSPMCAALPTSWGSKQGSVPGLLAVLHVSGHASETRPLQLTQITDENDEMSSAACSTYNPPPSMHDLMDPFLGSDRRNEQHSFFDQRYLAFEQHDLCVQQPHQACAHETTK